MQVRLYEDFAKSRAKRSVEETITHGSPEKEPKNKQHQHVTHIFQVCLLNMKSMKLVLIVFGEMHFLQISENEFFQEMKRDGRKSFMDFM